MNHGVNHMYTNRNILNNPNQDVYKTSKKITIKYIFENYPELFKETFHKILQSDDGELLFISDEMLALADLSREELNMYFVKKNGLLLEHISNPSDNVILEAINNNGEAIKYVPKDRQTMELCFLALQNTITNCKYFSDTVINEIDKIMKKIDFTQYTMGAKNANG